MKLELIRKPNGNTRPATVLIALSLLLGLVPTVVVATLVLLVAWAFSIFHPFILVVMTLVVAVCTASAVLELLILFDIAIGRAGLGACRVIGTLVFICIGFCVAYFLINENNSSHFYSPFSAWELIAIQCSAVFPLLIPLTSIVLHRKKALLFGVYFMCFPVLWWWGSSGLFSAVEAITHSNAERIERMSREEHEARVHNRVCKEKVIAIRALDPVVDAQQFYGAYGEMYIPWKYGYEFMSFPGLPEERGADTSHEFRIRLTRMNQGVLNTLPQCLGFPPDANWRQSRYTDPFEEAFEKERRAYLSAFNLEMDRIAKEPLVD